MPEEHRPEIATAMERVVADQEQQIQAWGERWKGIYAREESRWEHATTTWQLATEADGHLSWKPYPRTASQAQEGYDAALTAMAQERETQTYAHAVYDPWQTHPLRTLQAERQARIAQMQQITNAAAERAPNQKQQEGHELRYGR
jgi:hypothetical protein